MACSTAWPASDLYLQSILAGWVSELLSTGGVELEVSSYIYELCREVASKLDDLIVGVQMLFSFGDQRKTELYTPA